MNINITDRAILTRAAAAVGLTVGEFVSQTLESSLKTLQPPAPCCLAPAKRPDAAPAEIPTPVTSTEELYNLSK